MNIFLLRTDLKKKENIINDDILETQVIVEEKLDCLRRLFKLLDAEVIEDKQTETLIDLENNGIFY